MNPKCQKMVSGSESRWPVPRQCRRDAGESGFCTQHAPKTNVVGHLYCAWLAHDGFHEEYAPVTKVTDKTIVPVTYSPGTDYRVSLKVEDGLVNLSERDSHFAGLDRNRVLTALREHIRAKVVGFRNKADALEKGLGLIPED
jgi:hypothetical protein